VLSRNTIMPAIMGTYRIGSLSPQSFTEFGRELERPYYAMTDQEGRFEIGGILSGMHKTVIWHPYLGGTKE